ncbi:MAG: small-conductance mechanosensitive channel [Pseudanabaena frigida]|uniref:Small-conductance mechanosensitive channel n=1 Tax=Pseudanabaena frigida TaxID=945775 RepID=A0A2W4W484_9CYAN|nr:MAG: small-conductance mechanosensitive channel [Pseudanabaena frigida]
MLQSSFSYLFIWAIALIVGLALSVIILGEVIYRLQNRRRPLASTLLVVRNFVLPMFAFMLFVQYVLQRPASDEIVKAVQTLFWVCVLHAALSLLNAIIFEQAKADTWRARVPKLLIDLFRLFLVLLGTAIVLATVWNADLAGLVTALGVSSIVIGLALQDTLGSVMSGIALLFERPFSVGDWLKIGDIQGQVIDINWRAVRLITFEREMVIIPHKLMGSEIIRNFSQPQSLHAERISVGFSYKDPPNLAKHVLHSTALETQGILKHPDPQIFTVSYDDSAITYEVKFFIADYGELEEIRDRFMSRLWYAAQRNSLTIPFPIRTLYHFHGPTSQAEGTSKKFTESLQSLPAFVPLDKSTNTDNTASGIALQHFGSGETVIKQGSENNSLYIIVAGSAMITVKDSSDESHEMLTVKTGEFFGEMTLFSGESSPISVTAVEDLEVMMISATAVNQMIDRQPNFAREISQILETRRRVVNTIQNN